MNEQVIPAGAQVVSAQPSVDYNIFIQELTTMKIDFNNFLIGRETLRDNNGNKITEKTSRAYMNDNGRKAVMSWVNNYVNPNVYLAMNEKHNVANNYNLDNLNMLTMLFMNLNEFELTIEDANTIHSEFCGLMHHALMRSMTDKKYIFPTINTNYSQGGQPMQQEPKKLWGLF
jgi:hypothetical protein